MTMLRENELLLKENDRLKSDAESFLKSKEMSDDQVMTLTKSLERLQKDIKDKEKLASISTELLLSSPSILSPFSVFGDSYM